MTSMSQEERFDIQRHCYLGQLIPFEAVMQHAIRGGPQRGGGVAGIRLRSLCRLTSQQIKT